MPDDANGPEQNNTGSSPEVAQQPVAPISPEQIRTAEVVEAAREAVDAEKPQPVLEDIAAGGTPDAAESPDNNPPLSVDTTSVYDASRDPMVIAAENAPDPSIFLDKPMTPETRAAIQAVVDRKMNLGTTSGQPPETPPPVITDTEGNGGDDEMARLHSNIEAIAQQRDRVGTTAPESAETAAASPAKPLEDNEGLDDDVDFSNPNPVGGIPPEPTPTVDDEPPEGETPPDEGAEHAAGDAVAGAGAGGAAELPEDPEERLRSMYERISPEARDARVKKLRKHISRLESRMNNLSNLDDMETLQGLIDNAQLDLDLVEDVQKEKNDPNAPEENKGSSYDRDDEAARKLDETVDEYRRFGESTFDQLKAKETTEQNALKGLREQLSRAKTKKEKDLISGRITEAEARLAVIKSFKAEKEVGHLGEKNAEAIREAELRRRELGEVGYLDENIKKNKADLEGIDKNILDIEAKVLNETEGSTEWKRLNHEKLALSKRANKIRETLRLDEDALKVAKEKAKKEKGTSTVPTLENIDQKTDDEFGMMSRADQMKYLETVGRLLPPLDGNDYDALNAKAIAGEPLSIEQRAYLQREISKRLLNGTYDAKCLAKLGAQYGEVSDMVVEKFMRSKQLEKWRRENCPNGWEKMIDLAKKYPAIMAILALLIAGGVASSGGVLPALGMTAGGAKSFLG